MIYPNFLSDGGIVGITAPSAGVGDKLESFDLSLSAIREAGYLIKETASVRNKNYVSADGQIRAREFAELIKDNEVGYLLMAAGGDFMMDMLPYFDFDLLRRQPKWIQGYSDVTNILYPVTTLLDIATVYGPNAGGFDRRPLHAYQQTALDFIGGRLSRQTSFDLCATLETRDGEFVNSVRWNAVNGDFTASGRLLGGCLDCLCETVAGTKYDGTAGFLRRYHADGVIWYFDIFSMSAEATARGLWKLSELGWFDNASAFIFGRVMFPSTFLDMSYETAVLRELGHRANIVMDADIGHLPPSMTIVNGAKATLIVKDGGGILDITLT